MTRKYLVWAGGLGLLSVIMLLTTMIPQFQSSWTVKQTLDKERVRLAKLEEKEQELRELPLSPTFNQIEQVNKVLPSKKPLLELLGGLNRAVETSGVRVTSVELAPGKIASEAAKVLDESGQPPSQDFGKLDIILTTSGQLSKINTFFDAIETIAPFTSVTGITLNKRTTKDTNAALNSPTQEFEAKLSLTTYFFTKSIIAALETPLPKLGAIETQSLQEITSFVFPTIQSQGQIQGGGVQDLFDLETLQQELGQQLVPDAVIPDSQGSVPQATDSGNLL